MDSALIQPDIITSDPTLKISPHQIKESFLKYIYDALWY